MDINKVLYHLREADKELNRITKSNTANEAFGHQSYLAVLDFVIRFNSFYAYIGFEDIVNMAEETKNPTKIVPLAILLSLIFSTLLYVILSISCTAFIPQSIFENSRAPLVSIIEHKGYNTTLMSLVSIVAIIILSIVRLC